MQPLMIVLALWIHAIAPHACYVQEIPVHQVWAITEPAVATRMAIEVSTGPYGAPFIPAARQMDVLPPGVLLVADAPQWDGQVQLRVCNMSPNQSLVGAAAVRLTVMQSHGWKP